MPFGQDRLVSIFLATLAVRQKSQLIRFRTAAEMLDSFGMHTGGKEYRRLVEPSSAFLEPQSSSERDTLSGKVKVVQRSRFNFLREAQIWYTRTPNQRVLSADLENLIMLSDDFYQEIVAHPVPNDLETVKLLAASPAVLDLYMWLSYRCFKAKGVDTIPIFGEFGLANQIGHSGVLAAAALPGYARAVAQDHSGNVAGVSCPHQFGWAEPCHSACTGNPAAGGCPCLIWRGIWRSESAVRAFHCRRSTRWSQSILGRLGCEGTRNQVLSTGRSQCIWASMLVVGAHCW
ncbi:MAG: replication protein RepA [Bryobacteraceae bacterium]